jgi:hypothetical protein
MNREELRRLVIGGGLVLLGLILFFGRFSIAEFFGIDIVLSPPRSSEGSGRGDDRGVPMGYRISGCERYYVAETTQREQERMTLAEFKESRRCRHRRP